MFQTDVLLSNYIFIRPTLRVYLGFSPWVVLPWPPTTLWKFRKHFHRNPPAYSIPPQAQKSKVSCGTNWYKLLQSIWGRLLDDMLFRSPSAGEHWHFIFTVRMLFNNAFHLKCQPVNSVYSYYLGHWNSGLLFGSQVLSEKVACWKKYIILKKNESIYKNQNTQRSNTKSKRKFVLSC